MAFPAIAAFNTSAVGPSSSTTHNVALPSGIVAGNLLLVVICTYGGQVPATPAGWASLGVVTWANSIGGPGKLCLFRKTATGSEGATQAFTTSVADNSAHISLRITGWNGTDIAASAGVDQDNTASPNPDALTPGWGAADDLWLAIMSCGGAAPAISSPPAAYTTAAQVTVNDGGGTFRLAVASRQLNAASDNPGAFTLAASELFTVAQTVSLRGASASLVPVLREHYRRMKAA
ncbi:MAG: hypothetical protein ACM31O_14080 [Bacteroidota bacterium]